MPHDFRDDYIPIPRALYQGVNDLLCQNRVEHSGDKWLAGLWLLDARVPKSAVAWMTALLARGGKKYQK